MEPTSRSWTLSELPGLAVVRVPLSDAGRRALLHLHREEPMQTTHLVPSYTLPTSLFPGLILICVLLRLEAVTITVSSSKLSKLRVVPGAPKLCTWCSKWGWSPGLSSNFLAVYLCTDHEWDWWGQAWLGESQTPHTLPSGGDRGRSCHWQPFSSHSYPIQDDNVSENWPQSPSKQLTSRPHNVNFWKEPIEMEIQYSVFNKC